ncbi:MAG TPA: helix-turn-helix domain-containing protein [Candidatus Goldiibacteriota bacterium]|nr:helix-turn-helix domain-containing protein [Candidatus Goldiibacteriota bacterium]
MRDLAIKIKRYRELIGLTQEQLADKAGITRPAYNSIENGKSEPRASNLYKIAKALGRKMQDLLEPIPEIAEVRFRCRKCKSKKEMASREKILSEVKIWLNNFCRLEEIMGDKKTFNFSLTAKEAADPIKAASKAREFFKLDAKSPINDMCGLVESAGIRLYFFDSDLDKLFGLSLIHENKYPAIAVNINKDVNIERRIFTVAHELGHLLMHKESFNVNESIEIKEQEDAADLFAGHFLMPDSAFDMKWDENRGIHWVDNVLEIKRYFRVSYKTVLRRMLDKRMVDDSRVYKNFAQLIKYKYGHDLKGHYEPFKLENVDFLEVRLNRLVREAIEKELISVSRAAEILGISLENMLERGRSWDPPDGQDSRNNQ